VKFGVNAIEDAARSLLQLSEGIEHEKCGAPYNRADEVSVVPIEALGP
jgi:hypothetical protein